MSTVLNPYLNFRGQAREAMTFYQSAFGGELTISTIAEYGGMGVPEEETGQVMHAMLTVNESVHLMGSDVPSVMPGDWFGQLADRYGVTWMVNVAGA